MNVSQDLSLISLIGNASVLVQLVLALLLLVRCERLLGLQVVVARSGGSRSREVGADHAGRQEQGRGGKQGRPGDAPEKG